MRTTMGRLRSCLPFARGCTPVRLAIGLALAGCSRSPPITNTLPLTEGVTATCSSDRACPASTECVISRCERGTCAAISASPGSRCSLNVAFAQRQADLVPSELNEYGVCYESHCMPRMLCMQHCGEKLTKAIRPSLQASACSDERDCSPLKLDPSALARAES